MSWWLLIGALVFGVGIFIFVTAMGKKHTKRLNVDYFQKRWQSVIDVVKQVNGHQLAIIEADKILEEVLKKCRYAGKTTGERLVSAQKALSNNDAVWHAHKLRNKIVHEANNKLKAKEVEEALRGFRQALKDLGALK